MSYENDLNVLAKTIYGEARGESLQGKKAVASVIINRFKKSGAWFAGKSIAETCQFRKEGSKYHQFSCWNEFDRNRRLIENATPKEMGESFLVAEKFMNGEFTDIVDGACHYCHVKLNPRWAKDKMPDFTIGKHKFFKGIN